MANIDKWALGFLVTCMAALGAYMVADSRAAGLVFIIGAVRGAIAIQGTK